MDARDDTFTVTVARTGRSFEVPPDKTILDVLREAGIPAPASCRAGTCGACEVTVVEGVPDHQDYVLRAAEQDRKMMICVSRSQSKHLVIDL